MTDTYSTGISNNGGIAMVGNPGAVDAVQNIDSLVFNKPTAPWRVIVAGTLPTDASDARTPTNVAVSVYEGAMPLFSANASMSIQGQSSATDNKKGYKFKFTNPTTGNKLNLKIGDWFPSAKWDLKGYAVDRTLVRDTISAALWRDIRRTGTFPDNLIAPKSVWDSLRSTDLSSHASALFSTDGFPVEMWKDDGSFFGMFVWRTTADLPDYLLDETNRNHIQIQPQHAGGIWDHAFVGTDWSITSPKIKKYTDQMDITTAAPDVQAAGTRFIQWCLDVRAGNVDMRQTYPFYIDLQSWLDYILFCEVAGSADSRQNNFNMTTWDGTIWHQCAYDMDETWGISFDTTVETSAPEYIGFVMNQNTQSAWAGTNFFQMFFSNLFPEMRARWAELRKAGTISYQHIADLVTAQTKFIDPAMMEADLEIWPPDGLDVIDYGTAGRNYYTFILDWANRRIAWLDTQFGYAGP